MKKILIIFFVIACAAAIAFGINAYLYTPESTITFNESNKELFNPSRGFYVQIYSSEEERLADLRKDNIKVVLIAYDIENYKDTVIPNEKLKELDTALGKARENNIKVIFRAAYGFDSKYKDPSSKEQLYGHIRQIAPIINSNKDVILAVQAGFIGPWGEWHSSKFLTGGRDEIQFRNETISLLLKSLDKSITIALRRPRFIRDAVNADLDVSRLSLHNDALFSTRDDMGTYDDKNYTREQELAWAKSNLPLGKNGGEMPLVSEYSNIDNAVNELSSLHVTYLNCMYNKKVLEQWKSSEYRGQNGLEYVNNHLGYRLWLKEIKLPETIKSNRELVIKTIINNSGFAPIPKGYKGFLTFRRGDHIVYEVELDGQLSMISNDMDKEFITKIPKGKINETHSKDEILVGIYIVNDPADKSSGIELANDKSVYKEGINFFAKYIYQDDRYELDK